MIKIFTQLEGICELKWQRKMEARGQFYFWRKGHFFNKNKRTFPGEKCQSPLTEINNVIRSVCSCRLPLIYCCLQKAFILLVFTIQLIVKNFRALKREVGKRPGSHRWRSSAPERPRDAHAGGGDASQGSKSPSKQDSKGDLPPTPTEAGSHPLCFSFFCVILNPILLNFVAEEMPCQQQGSSRKF